ncbi:MAG: hypothetical protein WBD40_14655 [Tepidisphaeraceae bacterium]
MRLTPLLFVLCVMAASSHGTLAQYGGNSNTRNRDGNTSNSNSRNTPRSRVESTDRESEETDEREARRDAGREESVNKGKTPGLSEGPEVVGAVDEKNWGKLSPEQQAAAVAELKKFAEDAKMKVNGGLAPHETKYFLFYSDLKPAEAQKWAGLLDRMYAKLGNLFGVKSDENIFHGKALVFVFSKEQDYLVFQKIMHETDATGTAGLCHQYGNGDVHIAFFRQTVDQDFAAVLVHESVHGFLHRYKKPPEVPTWVNEGLAETIAADLVPQKGKRQELRQFAIGQVREHGGVGSTFFTTDRLEPWQYPVAATLAEFMIKANKKNYVAFIDGIKDGMKWQDALTQKYGAPLDRLIEAYGAEYNIRGMGGPNQQPDPRRAQEPNRDREEEERRKERE